jgi:hypothetical protein
MCSLGLSTKPSIFWIGEDIKAKKTTICCIILCKSCFKIYKNERQRSIHELVTPFIGRNKHILLSSSNSFFSCFYHERLKFALVVVNSKSFIKSTSLLIPCYIANIYTLIRRQKPELYTMDNKI